MSRSSRIGGFALAGAILLLDFLSKRIVLAEAESFARGIPLIDGLLRFTYVRNAGAAFGMFQGGRWPFVVVSSLAMIGLSTLLWRGRAHGLRRIAYSMILAGAAGNLVDRLFYDGLVVDFIEMGLRGKTFPVYNVADMAVSIGAAVLVLGMLREDHQQAAQPGVSEEAQGTTPLPVSSPSLSEREQSPVAEHDRAEPEA